MGGDIRYKFLSAQGIVGYDFRNEEFDSQFFLNASVPLRKFRFSIGSGYDFDDEKICEKLDVNYDFNGIILGVYGKWNTEFKFDKKNWTELMNFSEIYKGTFGIYGGYRFCDAYNKNNRVKTKTERLPMNLFLGTSYMYTHFGVSFDYDNWEFGSKFYITYPNLYIYRRDQIKYSGYKTGNDSPDRTYAGLTSFGIDGSALYYLYKDKVLSIEAGPQLFVYQFHGDYIDVAMRNMNINLNLDLKATVNIGRTFGLYIETGLPVFALTLQDGSDAHLPTLKQLMDYDVFCLKYMSRVGCVIHLN